MSATRNRNTLGNHQMEVAAHAQWADRQMYEHGPQGNAYAPCLPGNGLLPGKLGRDSLALNSVDVESSIFGLGSTNLARPQDNLKVRAAHVVLPSMDLFESRRTYAPRPIVPDLDARPRYI